MPNMLPLVLGTLEEYLVKDKPNKPPYLRVESLHFIAGSPSVRQQSGKRIVELNIPRLDPEIQKGQVISVSQGALRAL